MRYEVLSQILGEDTCASALIWFDYDLNMSIYVFNNTSVYPYFAIFNNTDISKANKCSRIYIMENKYIIVKDKRNWYLDDDMKKELVEILNEINNDGYTIWESIISEYFTEQYRLFLTKDQLPRIQIPDYNNLDRRNKISIDK